MNRISKVLFSQIWESEKCKWSKRETRDESGGSDSESESDGDSDAKKKKKKKKHKKHKSKVCTCVKG